MANLEGSEIHYSDADSLTASTSSTPPIHPACALCKGACCEGLAIPVHPIVRAEHGEFLKMHGAAMMDPGQSPSIITGTQGLPAWYHLPAKCSALNACGRCTLWPNHPDICKGFAVGSTECLRTVNALRPNDAAAIHKAIHDAQRTN